MPCCRSSTITPTWTWSATMARACRSRARSRRRSPGRRRPRSRSNASPPARAWRWLFRVVVAGNRVTNEVPRLVGITEAYAGSRLSPATPCPGDRRDSSTISGPVGGRAIQQDAFSMAIRLQAHRQGAPDPRPGRPRRRRRAPWTTRGTAADGHALLLRRHRVRACMRRPGFLARMPGRSPSRTITFRRRPRRDALDRVLEVETDAPI